MNPVRVSFVAGDDAVGEAVEWRIERVVSVRGETLPDAKGLRRIEGADFFDPKDARWVLQGVRSNERYVEREEKVRLAAVQEGLGRPNSRQSALIPIKKTAAWWDLAQDERRAIFEARSRHNAIGMKYLPAIARRLYHCRDLGGPFDFLTWFEFGDGDIDMFDDLVGRLRETEEWAYVEREVEVRSHREP
jgi:chlorite dismutase